MKVTKNSKYWKENSKLFKRKVKCVCTDENSFLYNIILFYISISISKRIKEIPAHFNW